MTTPDHVERIRAMREAAKSPVHCPIEGPCKCPTCGATELLLQGALYTRGISRQEYKRVTIRGAPLAGGHPHLASVRVDGREVFRIERRPDEVFAEDAMNDILSALRRAA